MAGRTARPELSRPVQYPIRDNRADLRPRASDHAGKHLDVRHTCQVQWRIYLRSAERPALSVFLGNIGDELVICLRVILGLPDSFVGSGIWKQWKILEQRESSAGGSNLRQAHTTLSMNYEIRRLSSILIYRVKYREGSELANSEGR
ncbi:hypothetical protein KM043_018393 [Ampulex compressa]|nr:hypothetical protein KM043_018393 [Ampulex compressa]